jgi:hypothetical protein
MSAFWDVSLTRPPPLLSWVVTAVARFPAPTRTRPAPHSDPYCPLDIAVASARKLDPLGVEIRASRAGIPGHRRVIPGRSQPVEIDSTGSGVEIDGIIQPDEVRPEGGVPGGGSACKLRQIKMEQSATRQRAPAPRREIIDRPEIPLVGVGTGPPRPAASVMNVSSAASSNPKRPTPQLV